MRNDNLLGLMFNHFGLALRLNQGVSADQVYPQAVAMNFSVVPGTGLTVFQQADLAAVFGEAVRFALLKVGLLLWTPATLVVG